MTNNSLDNVNSLNNILWNIVISYNKQNIVFYCISQLACYIIIIKKCCRSKWWNACWQRGLSMHLHRTIGRVGTVATLFAFPLVFQRLFALESQNFNTIKPHQSATHPHCRNTCTYDYIHTIYTWIDNIKCCNWPHKWGRLQQSTGAVATLIKM